MVAARADEVNDSVTARRRLMFARMLVLAVWRFLFLMFLLGMIAEFPPLLQLVVLAVGIAVFVAHYAFQRPARLWLDPRAWTAAGNATSVRKARAAAVLLLRRPPNIPLLMVAMMTIAIMVPFAVGQSGLCHRGGVIDVGFGLTYKGDELASPAVRGSLVILRVVAFALVEEFTFRGWLFFPLRKMIGPRTAVAVTSFLFAMAHMRIHSVRNDLLNGVIFGTSAAFSGSIWVPVSLHLAYNAGVWAWSLFFEAFGAGAISCSTSLPVFFVLVTLLIYAMWRGRRGAAG